jgi:hypothetical protein
MASLTIERDSGYADRIRAYQVIVDGTKVGEVRNGETKQFFITPGQHQFWLKIDWCGSKTVDFTVSEGDEIRFCAKSNLRGIRVLAAVWYALFDRNSYLLLERKANSSSQIV